ncbi:MAG TPA: hypothetical protein VIJ14_06310, partial [Rhabdochlamydiaceae bacterium]
MSVDARVLYLDANNTIRTKDNLPSGTTLPPIPPPVGTYTPVNFTSAGTLLDEYLQGIDNEFGNLITIIGGLSLGSSTLAGLTDVVLTSPATNDLLFYDGATSKWLNRAILATDIPTLNQNTTGNAATATT